METPAVPVTVRKLTPEESENLKIRGPKPQRSVTGHSSLPKVLGIAGAIAAVMLGIAIWLLVRRRRAAAVELAAQIPPDKRALPLLLALRERASELETGRSVFWMEEYTDVLKDYIHGVWGDRCARYDQHGDRARAAGERGGARTGRAKSSRCWNRRIL